MSDAGVEALAAMFARQAEESRAWREANPGKPWWARGQDDDEVERLQRVVDARRGAESCANCGRPLEPDEPIWRCKFWYRYDGGKRWTQFGTTAAPVCADCWENRPPLVDFMGRTREEARQKVRDLGYFHEPHWYGDERKGKSFDLVTGRPAREEHEWDHYSEPCDGCGRPVTPGARQPRQRWFLCSDRCLRKVRREAKGPTLPVPCEVCDEKFTPTRKDARYCTDACRQYAYRQRKREAAA